MARTYRTQLMDTWDIISKRLFDSEFFINELIKANPQFAEVAFFSDGVMLNVPKVNTASQQFEQNLPPWKRGAQNAP